MKNAVGRIFEIATGINRTTDEVIASGNYSKIFSSGWVHGETFPMRPLPLGPRRIKLLGFDRPMDCEGAIIEAKKEGLEQPWYEDALFFGEQCLKEVQKLLREEEHDGQYHGGIIFPHKPQIVPYHSEGQVLVLDYDLSDRMLEMGDFGLRRIERCRYAFVVPIIPSQE